MNGAPDFIEPVRGWRIWQAVRRRNELYLKSLFFRVPWPSREPLEATCHMWRPPWRRQPVHGAPAETCRCGIYAADLGTVVEYLSPYPPRGEWPVIGRVLLWGSVVECTDGWRASSAYPEALYVPASPTRSRSDAAAVAEGLVRRYEVPVELIEPWRPKDVARTIAAAQPSLMR